MSGYNIVEQTVAQIRMANRKYRGRRWTSSDKAFARTLFHRSFLEAIGVVFDDMGIRETLAYDRRRDVEGTFLKILCGSFFCKIIFCKKITENNDKKKHSTLYK